jgi:hypothetical protein
VCPGGIGQTKEEEKEYWARVDASSDTDGRAHRSLGGERISFGDFFGKIFFLSRKVLLRALYLIDSNSLIAFSTMLEDEKGVLWDRDVIWF